MTMPTTKITYTTTNQKIKMTRTITAIFDFAESIELDDKDVAKEVDEVGDGNVNVGGDISNNEERGDGDGDGGGVAM